MTIKRGGETGRQGVRTLSLSGDLRVAVQDCPLADGRVCLVRPVVGRVEYCLRYHGSTPEALGPTWVWCQDKEGES